MWVLRFNHDTPKLAKEQGITHASGTFAGPADGITEADCTLDMVSWGVAVRLVAESPALLERMKQMAPFGSAVCESTDPSAPAFALRGLQALGEFRLWCNRILLAEEESLECILDQLSAHLTLHIAEHAPDHVFVHAGVVAWRGRGLVLPGISFAGKSTLVYELVRAGATYFSDEFAVIDRDGLVHPFPRDLRMRQPGRPEQTPVPIAQLEGRAGTAPVPVVLVVFTEFDVAGRWSPQAMSPGRAALELLLHTFPVQRAPARVLGTFATLMHRATAWSTPRGEASHSAAALLSALESKGAFA